MQVLQRQNPTITHRDLKIENVLIGADGSYKICDFGSCNTRDQVYTTHAEIVTEQDNISAFSTPSYRSPEMVDLYRRQRVNHKADQWALGCILYLLAFFRHPFMEGNLQILEGKYRLPPEHGFSNYFLKTLQWLLEADPGKRPEMGELLSLLIKWKQFLDGKGVVPDLQNTEVEDTGLLSPAEIQKWKKKKHRLQSEEGRSKADCWGQS